MIAIIFLYSFYAGFLSFRSPSGSYYIQALCRALKANATTLPMCSILTNVHREIATNFVACCVGERDGAKQMPCYHSTLTRTLQFNDKTCNAQQSVEGIIFIENGTTNGSIPAEVDGENSICSRITDFLFSLI